MRKEFAMATARCSKRGVLEECDRWCICPKRLCVDVENALPTKGKSMRWTVRGRAMTAMSRHRERQTAVTFWCVSRLEVCPLRYLFTSGAKATASSALVKVLSRIEQRIANGGRLCSSNAQQ